MAISSAPIVPVSVPALVCPVLPTGTRPTFQVRISAKAVVRGGTSQDSLQACRAKARTHQSQPSERSDPLQLLAEPLQARCLVSEAFFSGKGDLLGLLTVQAAGRKFHRRAPVQGIRAGKASYGDFGESQGGDRSWV